MSKKLIKVKCPHCSKEFSYYKSEFRPFCSERCKMIDMGHWLEETYSVPGEHAYIPEEENDEEY